MNFYLTTKAKEDLINIAIYTKKNWGIEQRNDYLEKIDSAFQLLAKSPNTGRKCDNIKSGYYRHYVGKHVIFYQQVSSKEIGIIRILHINMDVSHHI